MKNKEILAYIEEKLLAKDFILHEYKAHSTCSLYLKLDYGASNSIRISDHKGYDHLSYKYEINQKCAESKWYKDKKGFWRYNCKADKENIDKLINIILNDRQYKRSFYNYDNLVENYKNNTQDKKGFWQKCRKVDLHECRRFNESNA